MFVTAIDVSLFSIIAKNIYFVSFEQRSKSTNGVKIEKVEKVVEEVRNQEMAT